MICLTHVMGEDGTCSRCSRIIPSCCPAPAPGDLVGIIQVETLDLSDQAYLILRPAFDTNQLCQPNEQTAA